MVKSNPESVDGYLRALPDDRRQSLETIRKVILDNLQPGFEEGIDFGMIGYYIPLSRYPKTYNGHPLGLAALAAQKSYLSLYLMNVYGDPDLEGWFRTAWAATGKKLDMGKSCIRFKTADDLPLEVIGEAIRRTTVDGYLAKYEAVRRRK